MRSRGFSLVEFMIAITIGLFLVGGLVYLIAETSRSRAEMERSSRQIENGRYALDRLAEDLRHAGFYGDFVDVTSLTMPGTTLAAGPCETSVANLPNGMALAIQGYETGAGPSVPSDLATCPLVAADLQPNTDILVVRRASTSTIAKAATDANTAYIQSLPGSYTLNTGPAANFSKKILSSDSTIETQDALVRRYIVRIYFVSRCNVPASGTVCVGDGTDDGGNPIPTLKMLELTSGAGAPAFQKLAIAEGIEHLELDFGIDNTPATVNPATGLIGDGVADSLSMCSPTCSVADWSNVVTVRVNLVARNAERSPSYADDKTYSLGLKGYTTATDDAFRRHAYTSLVRLNNVGMKREAD